jgi:hypothetical protein
MSTVVVGVTVECNDLDRVARFWREALEVATVSAPSSDLRVIEVAGCGRPLRLTLRRVTSRKFTRNRVRLDLVTRDLDRETARLIALGAIRIDGTTEEAGRATLTDVEGNEFDVLADGFS